MVRIAVLDLDRCKPKDCNKECYRFCPRVRSGDKTIEFNEVTGKPVIAELLCSGCGICVKKCPFKAIRIVNLPDELEEECSHRYGPNAFKLYRLPIPKLGLVLGLIGPNAVGKTTALKILAGEIRPNLGRWDDPPSWSEIIRYFRGSELQPYFQKLSEGKLRIFHKPQYVDRIPKVVKGEVGSLLKKVDERGVIDELRDLLELDSIWSRDIRVLSGGELQRVAIAACLSMDADIYLIDEPCAYLDVEQRIAVSRTIKRIVESKAAAAFVVEHDLIAQSLIADSLMVFLGEPGIEGYASKPLSLRRGMNMFLKDVGVTFRRDPQTGRPRVNKPNSWLDRLQKSIGEYYYYAPEKK